MRRTTKEAKGIIKKKENERYISERKGESMKTVLISEENRDRYAYLLPLQLAPLLYGELSVCIGLIKEGENGAVPVGLLIMSEETEDSATVEWIKVAEEEQNKGYGTALMEKAFQFVQRNEKETLRARIRFLSGETEEDPEGAPIEGFFTEMGFAPEGEDETERIFYLTDQNPVMPKGSSDPAAFTTLSALPPRAAERCLTLLDNEFVVDTKRLDPDACAVFCKGELPSAMITAEQFDMVFSLRYIVFDRKAEPEEADIESLIWRALYVIRQKVSAGGVIYIRGQHFDPVFLASKLFKSTHGIEARILSVPAYGDQIQRIREKEEEDAEKQADMAAERIPSKVKVVDVEYLSGIVLEDQP